MNEHTNLLEIKDLTVHYVTVDGTVHAVENLNLTLPEGKTLGLVGETGAGKTTTVKAIMQILPDPPAKNPNWRSDFLRGRSSEKKQKIHEKNPWKTDFHDFPGPHDLSKSCDHSWRTDYGGNPAPR